MCLNVFVSQTSEDLFNYVIIFFDIIISIFFSLLFLYVSALRLNRRPREKWMLFCIKQKKKSVIYEDVLKVII